MQKPELEIVSLCEMRSRKRCMEYALVLKAMGIQCDVLPGDRGFALVVHAQDENRAREQLRLYRQENRAWPPRWDTRLDVDDGLTCACLYGVTILFVYGLQAGAFSLDWLRAGMGDAGLIREGEWWRAVTALSLHGDAVHLAGNLVFGLAFSFLAGAQLGWGLAWSGMLLAGSLGNAVNAFVRAPDHISIGASTAVFATLGILAAYAWIRRQAQINRWAPLGGAVALLAFIGMGGERTDIFAHIAGLGAGGLFGLAFAVVETRSPLAPWHKQCLGHAASLFFVLAWTLALLANG